MISPIIEQTFRELLHEEGRELIGIPYKLGAEWNDLNKKPEFLDCSELLECLYKKVSMKMNLSIFIPDGSQNQWDKCISVDKAKIGDLAFFAKNAKSDRIYHVGILYDDDTILEARAYDPSASFSTGKVILRERKFWEQYKNFVGYKSHVDFGVH